MIITIVNMSRQIEDAELHAVIRAINRQVHEDFEPYWSLGATLRLEGRSTDKPEKLHLADMRGDAVLYLWDQVDVKNALGYHDMNARGIPYGFVFTKLAAELGEDWRVTLSHEALELIADPLVNLLVAGPHPEEDRTVFHWFEMSDAVQAESYQVDGVPVSNFVLPLYFTPSPEPGSRNDFLGRKYKDETLPSFGVNPGGYIGFFDPKVQDHVTFAVAGDPEARARLAIKKALTEDSLSGGRRAYRIGGWPREKALPPATGRARSAFTGEEPVAARGIQAATTAQMAIAVSAGCERRFEAIEP